MGELVAANAPASPRIFVIGATSHCFRVRFAIRAQAASPTTPGSARRQATVGGAWAAIEVEVEVEVE